MLGHMNQIKYALEYHFAIAYSIEEIDFERIEDQYVNYLFGGKYKGRNYIRPKDQLDKLLLRHTINKQ
jgi:hypothetical protein